MRVLALDSTTLGGSVAVIDGDRVLVEQAGDPSRSHAEQWPVDIVRALDTASVPISAIDLFAVAIGPGSFTGLRIGIATIQGLALVAHRHVVGISALDALALGAADVVTERADGAVVGAWMNAHRGEVYSALYRVTERPDRLTQIDSPAVAAPALTIERWASEGRTPLVLAGDGAVAYAPLAGGTVRILPPPLLAGTIGRMAAAREAAASAHPASLAPLYIRRPDAEVARDKRAAEQAASAPR